MLQRLKDLLRMLQSLVRLLPYLHFQLPPPLRRFSSRPREA